MFWCCSLETSHPRLLPQSLKDCSIHLCLFFCSAYRVIINIFLNSKIWNASRICVSSLRRGHANLLCIVPILVYVLPKRALCYIFFKCFPWPTKLLSQYTHWSGCIIWKRLFQITRSEIAKKMRYQLAVPFLLERCPSFTIQNNYWQHQNFSQKSNSEST